jgi:cytochrome c oxidase subunit II
MRHIGRAVGTAGLGTAAVLAFVVAGGASPRAEPSSAPARTIEITASRFKFEPDLIEVQRGERVMLVVRSADTNHGISIKELGVKAKIPEGGSPVSIELSADKPGTYTVSCAQYCGSGHSKMKARLVVSEAAR